MPRRMKRKRNFNHFSTGNSDRLTELLENADTVRLPLHSMFYVRVNDSKENQQNEQIQDINTSNQSNGNHNGNHNGNGAKPNKSPNNAFQALMMGSKQSKAINTQNANNQQDEKDSMEMDDIDEALDGMDGVGGPKVVYPMNEECAITKDVRVNTEWVMSFSQFDAANNMEWRGCHHNGRIHEYQISRTPVVVMKLDIESQEEAQQLLKEREQEIRSWTVDRRFSGFVIGGCYHLYQPHLYWNLVDDNKRAKVKQSLISDMFRSTKAKSKRSPWKPSFQ